MGTGLPGRAAGAIRIGLAAGLGAVAMLAIAPQPGVGQESDGVPVEDFVVGNALFLTYHEVAHVLIDDLEVPITGGTEHAADNLATLMMTPDPEDQDGSKLAAYAALGWLQDARKAQEAGVEQNFSDIHGLSETRAQQILCLVAGGEILNNSQDKFFGELVKARGGSDSYLNNCRKEADRIGKGWASALGDYFLQEGEEPSAEINVVYEDAPEALSDAYAYMSNNGVLDIVSADVQGLVHNVSPFTLVSRSCGKPDAFWSSSKREAVICYELVDWFIKAAP